ncbi:hypothetical protein BDV96DRAFT_607197 [Lophiotrema nucula]|uniref:Uncharacterized protein n=1 Tax=Lophiotrema nucula TaxID=690887 RepID=A0A6A5YI25_9PLEO|nr:hypothetical protein BDV96DRAFT_607197 [Lophiotrema nucula]
MAVCGIRAVSLGVLEYKACDLLFSHAQSCALIAHQSSHLYFERQVCHLMQTPSPVALLISPRCLAREHDEPGVDGYGKTLTWLFGRRMGAPTPATSEVITEIHVREITGALPSHPLFDRSPVLKQWREDWALSALVSRDVHQSVMSCLLEIGLSQIYAYSSGISYCFCRGRFRYTKDVRHCWHCHKCHEKESWIVANAISA